MADSGPRRIGVSIELKPHAYDPAANPELFEGVLARRLIAFPDRVVVILPSPWCLWPCSSSSSGMVTFGLGWFCSSCCCPGDRDLGAALLRHHARRPASATIGMRVMDLEMRTWYGAPAYFVLGAVHAVVSG